jgi:hypothetical protein
MPRIPQGTPGHTADWIGFSVRDHWKYRCGCWRRLPVPPCVWLKIRLLTARPYTARRCARRSVLLQMRMSRSSRVYRDPKTAGTVPRAAFRRRDHPPLSSLVFAVCAHLSRPGGDHGGTEPSRGPRHDLALGPALCACSESANSSRDAPSQSVLAVDETYVKVAGNWA